MKKISVIKPVLMVVGCLSLMGIQGCQEAKEAETAIEDLATRDQKVAYIRSYKLISRATKNGVIFDEKVMERAIYEAQNGIPSMIPKSEQDAVMHQQQKEFIELKKQKLIAQGEVNKQEAEVFLAQNALKEGIKVTDSGLQYRVLTAVTEDAPRPVASDTVKAHYRGLLLDGTVFKDTWDKDRPVDFKLDSVIAGWVEGIQLMKVGERFEFFVPASLAYGVDGAANGKIGINQLLKFEIELLSIEPKTPEENK